MTTHIRDLQPGERFYLLRTMERYTYVGVRVSERTGTHQHLVMRDGKYSALHHSCHVKRIVRAA